MSVIVALRAALPCPQVPRITGREEGRRGNLVDVPHPRLGGFFIGLNEAVALATQKAVALATQKSDAVDNPVHVLLNGYEHVGECRRASWTGDDEHVRKAGNA